MQNFIHLSRFEFFLVKRFFFVKITLLQKTQAWSVVQFSIIFLIRTNGFTIIVGVVSSLVFQSIGNK